MMTNKENRERRFFIGQFRRDERTRAQAFREGVEEGFVRAAELSGEPEAILRQFRPVCYAPLPDAAEPS